MIRNRLLAATLLLGSLASSASAATTVEVANFGSNPGKLRMFKHIPDRLPASAPLVVVMHGCTQDAVTYTNESGWIQMADQLHVALVMPQQQQANNSNSCFNWYDPTKTARDQGEAMSIKQMIDKMKADYSIDASRVFVTGLSAGGAMTSVMLADYPNVFAAGAIVAGLPYGCANSLTEALNCMQTSQPSGGTTAGAVGSPRNLQGITPALADFLCPYSPLYCKPAASGRSSGGYTAAQWGDFVRQASNATAYPRVSIWHGSADTTVSPANGTSEMQQWTNVHGIDPASSVKDTVNGYPHEVYKDASGKAMVETYSITGMAHGHPVDPGTGPDQCGTADKYVLNVHICSSLYAARFFGLANYPGA